LKKEEDKMELSNSKVSLKKEEDKIINKNKIMHIKSMQIKEQAVIEFINQLHHENVVIDNLNIK
jgi:phosphotransferase system HPr-like phosphotransfer protein